MQINALKKIKNLLWFNDVMMNNGLKVIGYLKWSTLVFKIYFKLALIIKLVCGSLLPYKAILKEFGNFLLMVG